MGRKGALCIELEKLLIHYTEKGCSFFNPNFITFLVLCLTLTFSGASGSAQEMCQKGFIFCLGETKPFPP